MGKLAGRETNYIPTWQWEARERWSLAAEDAGYTVQAILTMCGPFTEDGTVAAVRVTIPVGDATEIEEYELRARSAEDEYLTVYAVDLPERQTPAGS
jgi:hypothetical protein